MKSVHENSKQTLREEKDNLSRREKEVLGVLHQSFNGMTDREVMKALGYSDMNAVRPRITELVQKHWAKEVGNVSDPVTGKKVRQVKAIPAWERAKILEQIEEEKRNPQLSLL